ncbi:uncharacterized protein sS8_3551 [Methylocaldum marinum]|uniref:Uncharacterized protein n=1 Tax=Methylocaldum marinum TaxID=1432792 RepID=A0A250KV04_9GAMM|nr:hypothetical protein [Methylocaldum marinum]BBA35488.1 uncharacterized protein sS8_3551 [Methylocaldum marinum]
MKTIKSITLFSTFTFAALAPALGWAETADYLKVKESQVEWESKGKEKALDIEIETSGAVPMDGKAGAFGYGALTDGTNNVLVLVTHLPIQDSTHVDPKSGFHAHVLDLKQPTSACPGATLEVDLENSGNNKAFDANYTWSVKDKKIKIEDIPAGDLGDAGVENLVTFTIKPVLDAKQNPTNLCVTVAEQI